MQSLKANLATSQGNFFSQIDFDSQILSITKISSEKKGEPWLFPGHIDLHLHGGGGYDVMEGVEAMRKVLRTHASFGTTSVLATTVTETQEKLMAFFHDVAEVMANPKPQEAHVLGVHLEGPYISPNKLGAHQNLAQQFSIDDILQLHAIAPIRIITLAPESGFKPSDIKILKTHGILAQLGHTDCSFEDALEYFDHKIPSVTHLFNAMSSLHHRKPGLVGASLLKAEFAEIIPDLIHVHPGAIQLALKNIPSLYFVTDATSAAGMPDGHYTLGSQHVTKCANGVRLPDGTLAGSALMLSQVLRNITALGLTPYEASRRLSSVQADLLQLTDRGYIDVGYRADFSFIDHKFEFLSSYIEGQKL